MFAVNNLNNTLVYKGVVFLCFLVPADKIAFSTVFCTPA